MSRAKTQARRLAVQAMYQWSLNETSYPDLVLQFQEYDTWKKVDHAWFAELLQGAPKHIDAIDAEISQVADRSIDKIDLVELSVLRLGTYELLHHIEVPYKVVLNEYINLSKAFGSVKSHAYVNATLDKMSKTIRTIETAN